MSLALYGTDQPPSQWRTTHAGRLSFELEDGALRYVRAGIVEVLRGIAALVRDAAWGAVAATLDELSILRTTGTPRACPGDPLPRCRPVPSPGARW